MTQTYEDFSKYGKEFADTGLKSFASLSKGAQAIATEAGEYTKKSFEAGSAAVEKMFRPSRWKRRSRSSPTMPSSPMRASSPRPPRLATSMPNSPRKPTSRSKSIVAKAK